MEFIDPCDEILRLMSEGKPEQAGIIEAFWDTWEDLRVFRSRWGDLRFASAEVNEHVDEIELEHQAIEDDGAPLEVYPFSAVGPHDRLYSDPPCFVVADAVVGGFGESPRPGWEEEMRAAGIARLVIEKVRCYLDKHQAVYYSEELPDEQRGNRSGVR